MHKSEIKKFAIWARNQLRLQISQQAARFGLSATGLQAADSLSRDRLVLGEQVYGASEAQGYRALEKRYQQLLGQHAHKAALAWEQLIDEAAYSWFNRFCALRLMEVNGYLPRRVLSSAEGSHDPDVLRDALQIAMDAELPGITPELVDSLRHRDDGRLYRHLLVAQCNALRGDYPQLFDAISDELALLLPENLLQPEGLIRRLTQEIPEADWQQVEIIGWLYQYYISERKDAVIGAKKPVASPDIPAATQLFTPDWIVQYMVQNSLGKLWLESHPQSPLKAQMPYYLDTPPQSPEVQAQLDALKRPGLSPEALKVIDPACGSGHILVYAFDLLFEIYREQGYRERDIPALILEHNLVGLDIDQRAAQLAAFALLIKARQKLRQLKGLQPQVVQVQTSRGIELHDAESLGGLSAAELAPWQALVHCFKDADTLGSLLTPPPLNYPALRTQLQSWQQAPNAFVQSLAHELEPLLTQAELLSQSYDVVVANPPYMGGKGFNPTLKAFAQKEFPDAKSDLFAMFMQRIFKMTANHQYSALVVMQSWMFLSSFEKLRANIFDSFMIDSLLHMGNNVMKIAFGTSAVIFRNHAILDFKGAFTWFEDTDLDDVKDIPVIFPAQNSRNRAAQNGVFAASIQDFEKIPGAPVAYWASFNVMNAFETQSLLKDAVKTGIGLNTGNNDRFIREWFEVERLSRKWFPLVKGGAFRRWYGNLESVINWREDGVEIKTFPQSNIRNGGFYLKSALTWTKVSSINTAFRIVPEGFIFESNGTFVNCDESQFKKEALLGFLNSKVAKLFLEYVSATIDYQPGHIASLPLSDQIFNADNSKIETAINIAKSDWDSFETSWDFENHPMVRLGAGQPLPAAYAAWEAEAEARFRELQRLEVENNRYWIEAYGLQDELTPEVPDAQVTVRRAELGRDVAALLSYAVGCIMGRYSLDQPGLVHAGQPFEPGKHLTFAADADGIVPVHDRAWFPDDLVLQLMHWLKTVFGEAHYADNLSWLAGVLGAKASETPEQTLRRYFLGQFMKDHHQTYKKRPIYWFFSSGKKRAFNAYVYLHRYDSDTLARLRTDYLHPLQLKLEDERQRLALDPSQAKRLKALDDQIAEIQAYDEVLKHKADLRLPLDPDDGVAYNYTLFEGLVYEGPDLKMNDLKVKSQWKRDLLGEAAQEGMV